MYRNSRSGVGRFHPENGPTKGMLFEGNIGGRGSDSGTAGGASGNPDGGTSRSSDRFNSGGGGSDPDPFRTIRGAVDSGVETVRDTVDTATDTVSGVADGIGNAADFVTAGPDEPSVGSDQFRDGLTDTTAQAPDPSGGGSTSVDVTRNRIGKFSNTGQASRSSVNIPDPPEQFGDAAPEEIEQFTRGVAVTSQRTADAVGDTVGGGVETVVTAGSDRPIDQARGDALGDIASGAVSSVGLVGAAPQAGLEIAETGVFAARNPGEFADKAPGAAAQRLDRAVEGAQQRPGETAGQVIGSAGLSSAAFRATQGTRLGTPTRAAVQPGEELVKAGARRGVLGERGARVTPGVDADAIDFDNAPFSGTSRGQTDPSLGLAGRGRSDGRTGQTDTTPEVDVDDLPTDIGGTRPDFADSGGSPLNRGGFNQRLDTDTGSGISQQFRSDLEADSGLPSVDSPQVDFRTQFDDPVATDGTIGFEGVGTTAGVAGVGADRRQRSPTRERLVGGGVGIGADSDIESFIDNLGTGFQSDQRIDPSGRTETNTGTGTGQGLTEFELQRIRSETEITPDREARQQTEAETRLDVRSEVGTEIRSESDTRLETEPQSPTQEDDDREEDEQLFGLRAADEQFDSGILSGREALSSFDSQ